MTAKEMFEKLGYIFEDNNNRSELKKRTPEELVDKITELATDKIVKDKEIVRLNKIIDEFEKELKETYNLLKPNELVNGRNLINNTMNYLKELKEEGK